MSKELDRRLQSTGTKFLIFPQPQFLQGFDAPEIVTVSVPPERMQAGPADDRMYVVDAKKKQPYSYPYLPPYNGECFPPVMPDHQHFTHLKPTQREFKAAHMYAVVRRVLDIWEDYCGSRIEWQFAISYPRLELVPMVPWNNAHSGWGFLEFGFPQAPWGGFDMENPYCMNFDVLAHELGHSFVFSLVGVPDEYSLTPEYWGFHEAVADLVAIVSGLHFDLVLDHLLHSSRGNLFTVNELSRVGELSQSEEIRRAFNWDKLSTVGSEEHELSLPLTGAIFDVMVELFQKNLVDLGLISAELAERSYHGPDSTIDDSAIQSEFNRAYEGREEQFKGCLIGARDRLGWLLAQTLKSIRPADLRFVDVGNMLLKLDEGKHAATIRDCFRWREIGLEPTGPAARSHDLSRSGLRNLLRTRRPAAAQL